MSERKSIAEQFRKEFGTGSKVFVGTMQRRELKPTQEEKKEMPEEKIVDVTAVTVSEPHKNGNGLAKMLAEAMTPYMVGQGAPALPPDIAERLEKMEKQLKREARPITVKVGEREPVKVEKSHEQFPLLLGLISQRLPVFIFGPPGSGKTMAADKAAEVLSLKFYPQSVGEQTTLSHIMGYMDATGKYVRTVFREAYEHGGVYLLDEFDAGNANVSVGLNSALGNGYCSFPDGVVKRHEDFVCIAAGNTRGAGGTRQFVGRNPIDAATLDRFVQLEWGYDEKLESALVNGHAFAERIQAIRKAAEAAQSGVFITPRQSIMGVALIESGMKEKQVEDLLVWDKMAKSLADSIRDKI